MGIHTNVALRLLGLAALLAPAAVARGAAPATGPATEPTTRPARDYAAELPKLVGQLEDVDAQVRHQARLMVLNLPGDALEALTAARSREDLSPEARHALNQALPRVKFRQSLLRKARDDMQWSRRTNLAEYERAGHKDPKWDALVRQGMEDFSDISGPRVKAFHEFDAAIAAGCDDPYVLYLHARTMSETPQHDMGKVTEEARRAATGMLKSEYDAPRKMMVLYRCYQLPGTNEAPADEILKLAGETAKRHDVPSNWLVEVFHGMLDPLTKEIGREAAFKKIYPAYEAALPGSAWPLLLKGQFYTQFAWDARGSGLANTVTPEGWKVFSERLETAREALEQAWKIDPTNSAVADEMITVCLGQGGGRGRMEVWYRRAIEANPDDYRVCGSKLYYLYPRWHGSHQDMLAFGRECAKTENYYAGIPFILVDAHAAVAAESQDPRAYFQSEEVWSDISRVYEDGLLVYPTARWRSQYAQWAVRCGQWPTAYRQFKVLGDHPDPTVFPDRKAYDALREQARKAAGGEPIDGRL